MQQRTIWRYFLLTFGISWSVWLVAHVVGLASMVPPALWIVLGGAGPVGAALLLLYWQGTPILRRDYWQRVIDWRRVSVGWLAVCLLLPVLVLLGASVVLWLVRGTWATGLAVNPTQPVRLLGLVVFLFFFGPLPEELGWRGYVLDPMQRQWGAGRASLLLGLLWALWHVPYFLIDGSYQAQIGLGTSGARFYLANIILQAFVYTWIFNHTAHSTLAAILFHFATNFTGEIVATPPSLEPFTSGVWLLIVVLLVATRQFGQAGTPPHDMAQTESILA